MEERQEGKEGIRGKGDTTEEREREKERGGKRS